MIYRDFTDVKLSPDELLDFARRYLKLGWRVLPHKLKPGNFVFPFKWKFFEGWSSLELEKLWEKWALEGIRTTRGKVWHFEEGVWGIGVLLYPSRLLKLDADTPEAARWLKELADSYELPFVPTRSDGSRGHLYVRRPSLRIFTDKLRVGSFEVEIQIHRFSPLPPSPHGKELGYRLRWENFTFKHVPNAPDELLEHLRSAAIKEKPKELTQNLFLPKQTKKTLQNTDQIRHEVLELLYKLDLVVREESYHNGKKLLRLKLCPFCFDRGNPQQSDNPYCTLPNLFFGCFRTNVGCPANKRKQPPEKALPRLKKMREGKIWVR